MAQTAVSKIETHPEQSKVEIARGFPIHSRAVWEIYYAGRLAAQAHGDLTRSKIIAEFRDPQSSIIGRTTEDWRQMMADTSGRQAVLLSFQTNDVTETPKGIVRPSIDQYGVRHLNNLYVSPASMRQGHGEALFAAVRDWHQGEEFRFRVATYNDRALGFYAKMGCVASSEADLGYEMQGVFVPQTEMISPPDSNLLH